MTCRYVLDDGHPLMRRHVIPFQLQTEYDEFKTMREHYNLSNFLGEPYFQPGDWHDTLQAATFQGPRLAP